MHEQDREIPQDLRETPRASEATFQGSGLSRLKASWYVGVLIGAVLYASGKQSWDTVTAPIDLEKVIELARYYDAPILALPASEEVSWYPEVTVARDDAPPRHRLIRGM